jgi:hypothetical protein
VASAEVLCALCGYDLSIIEFLIAAIAENIRNPQFPFSQRNTFFRSRRRKSQQIVTGLLDKLSATC